MSRPQWKWPSTENEKVFVGIHYLTCCISTPARRRPTILAPFRLDADRGPIKLNMKPPRQP